jgi:uncharacterized protein (TIGR02058 family)
MEARTWTNLLSTPGYARAVRGLDYRRYIVEVGTGIDLHGEDETKAAQRAVKDAISHCSMVGLGQLFKVGSFSELEEAIMVDVTVATPNPERIDEEAVLGILPEGKRRLTAVKGGMRFPTESTAEVSRTHGIVMVNAVIVVLVDVDRLERK